MSSTKPDDAGPKAVRQALAELLGTSDLNIVTERTARTPSGETVTYLAGTDPSRPNSFAALTIDESGTIRPRAELEELTGRRLFVPDLPARPSRGPLGRESVTIDPKSNVWRLSECETASETVTVTIPPSGAVPKADVYLLADTTGSMGGILDAVEAGANAILSHPDLAGFDVAWGVGNYRDFPVGTGLNSYAFAHQLSPTTNLALVTAEIAAWEADEGSDTSEGQLFALEQIATDPAIGWRADSKRIIVWFGDEPGHDPICPAISGLATAITEATATAALVAADITVVAVSTDTGSGLDGDPAADAGDYSGTCPIGGTPGQGTNIATATGGSHTVGIDPTTVVETLGDLIADAVGSTASVTLVATGSTAEFVESISPPGGYGPLAGDETHVLIFEVVWRGTRPCADKAQVFFGTLDVVADGVVVAQKTVEVTVPSCRYHHSVEVVCGVAPKDDRKERCDTVVPGRYATAVTIYNPSTCVVTIEKRFAPLVLKGEAIGREPRTVSAKPFASIKLGPGEATMDDCCSLAEAVGPDPGLLLGVLDIVADRPIEVSAIHTARDEQGGPSISTRAIAPRRAP